jgi:hypothetical protein
MIKPNDGWTSNRLIQGCEAALRAIKDLAIKNDLEELIAIIDAPAYDKIADAAVEPKVKASFPNKPINPFPKPTPEVQCLRNVSQLLYEAWEETDKDSISTPLIEEAYDITWNAYVAVRKLLGDEVK